MNILVLLVLVLIIVLAVFEYISIAVAVILSIIAFYLLTLILADSDVTLQILEKIGRSPKKALKNKVVWVTGASSGVGKALALKLAKCGCRLAISARSRDKLEEVKQECIKEGKLEDKDVIVVCFDILDYTTHRKCFQTVVDHFDKIDILASNAGAMQQGRWEKTETSMDQSIFDLNVFSLLALARIVTEHFLQRGSGHHVVTSSIAGRIPFPMSSAYCASKYAIQGYFETLMTEYGSTGINVTLLDLGPVDTNIFDSALNNDDKKTYTYKKLMTAKRCASLIAVAITHKIPEVIICSKPLLFMVYFCTQAPTIAQWCTKFINFRRIHEIVNIK